MPWVGSEHLEVAPGFPAASTVVGDYIVVVDHGRTTPSGVLPLVGSFAVMNTLTGQAKVYTGLTTGTPNYANITTDGTYAWVATNTVLHRIHPPTGAVSTYPGPGFSSNFVHLCAVPGAVWATWANTALTTNYRRFDTSTSTWSNGTATASVRRSIYHAGSWWAPGWAGTGYQLHPTTGAVISSGSFGVASTDWLFPAIKGAVIYWPALGTKRVAFVNTATGTWGNVLLSMVGDLGWNFTLGPDGLLWTIDGGGTTLHGVNPATWGVITDTVVTSRARRYQVHEAQGELWIPSGEPL